MIINIYEAKTNLSKYIEMLEKKEEQEIIITRYDEKVAKITLFDEDKKLKRLGAGEGMFPDFKFDLHAFDEEIIKEFGM